MNKLITAVMLLLGLGIGFSSCTGKEEKSESDSIIGTWRSYMVDYLDEFGNIEGKEATGEFYIKFTEDEAILYIDDMPNDVTIITTDYTFKEGDNSIIYFPKAYSEYEQRIVAQVFGEQLVLQQTADDWDWGYRYQFSKQ